MQTSECRAAARFYIQSTALFGLNQVCFPGLDIKLLQIFFSSWCANRRELRYFRMRGKDVTSLVVYVLLVLPTSVSSLPSSHLLKTRRTYSQGVDTVLSAAKKQVYTIPTYDAAFKWVLSSNEVRPSFFRSFIPNLVIQSPERLDDHTNVLQKLQLLRHFLRDKGTSHTVKNLSSSFAYVDHAGKKGSPT